MTDKFESYYFSILNRYYPEFMRRNLFYQENLDVVFCQPIQSFVKLEAIIYEYAQYLGLTVLLVEIEHDFEELDRGLPLSCDILEPENKNIYKIGVSPFGKSNLDIALNEGILLLVQEKLLKDSLIPFDEDFIYDDDEFIPFLVFSSVYFGLSKPLIYRISSSGNYNLNPFENVSYTYDLPIQKENFLDSLILCAKERNLSRMAFLDGLPKLEEGMKKYLYESWDSVSLETENKE